ncbi:hypothetical protein HanRHA438_Chr14g0671051 [Helianthus annuus]|nr:hypothetical protein HanRHA438_Chr14g0671051 [Helianthus annuus]
MLNFITTGIVTSKRSIRYYKLEMSRLTTITLHPALVCKKFKTVAPSPPPNQSHFLCFLSSESLDKAFLNVFPFRVADRASFFLLWVIKSMANHIAFHWGSEISISMISYVGSWECNMESSFGSLLYLLPSIVIVNEIFSFAESKSSP